MAIPTRQEWDTWTYEQKAAYVKAHPELANRGASSGGGSDSTVQDVGKIVSAATTAKKAYDAFNVAETGSSAASAGAGGGGASLGSSAGSGAGAASGGTALGALGAGLGAGAVGYYYGPSYAKYAQRMMDNPETDDYLKSAMLTNPITAWAVPIADAMGIGIHAGKHKDQLLRDAVRKNMVEHGALGADFSLGLANGAKFDMGADGKTKNYNVDFSKDTATQDVDYLQPLANIITGGNEKASSDLTGQFLNASRSTGDARANQLQIYKNSGFDTSAKVSERLKQMLDAKLIDQQHYDVYNLGASRLFAPPSATPPPAAPSGFNASTPIPAANIDPGFHVGVPGYKPPAGPQPLAGANVSNMGWGSTPAPIVPGEVNYINPMTGAGPSGYGDNNNVGPKSLPPELAAQLQTYLAPRSKTLSPGIDKNGRRISY